MYLGFGNIYCLLLVWEWGGPARLARQGSGDSGLGLSGKCIWGLEIYIVYYWFGNGVDQLVWLGKVVGTRV